MNTTDTISITSPAKVNLILRVRGRRADGFHLLSMLNAPVSLSDNLTVQIKPGSGNVSSEIVGRYVFSGDDISRKSAKKFLEAFKISGYDIHIQVEKNIPFGAGLGGGSSNGASVLLLLADFFKVDKKEIFSLSPSLGSDLPFFIERKLSIVEGTGEKVKPLKVHGSKRVPILIVFPGEPVSTVSVYEKLRGKTADFTDSDPFLEKLALEEGMQFERFYAALTQNIRNDLEEISSDISPRIASVLSNLREDPRVAAGMSGSGAACFALPKSIEDGENILKEASQRVKEEGVLFFETINF